MLKDEAENIVGTPLSEEDYNTLNTVYMHYPGINSKDDLDYIFGVGGWTLIGDMLPRAKELMNVEKTLNDCEAQTKHLKGRVKELNGRGFTPSKQEGGSDLNKNELKVLVAMVNSSKGNGHDFGISEDLTEQRGQKMRMILPGLSKKQIVGYISSLSKKGYAVCYGIDSGSNVKVSQFQITKKGFRALGMDESLGVDA